MSGASARVASSRWARAAAFPRRLRAVSAHEAHRLATSVKWLAASREYTNFTYELTDLNLEHLAWWVSAICARPVEECRGYIQEILRDSDLREHVRVQTIASPRSGLADREAHFARRMGWYAIVRALRPNHVVETGTDKGLGTVVLAAAVLRNGSGHVTTVDVNEESGYLLAGRYAEPVTRIIQDSVLALRRLTEPVDLFIHDSWHAPEHERAEFAAVSPHLSPHAVLLSDNSHVTAELARWAEQYDMRFAFFKEEPRDHWYPGGGIGAAWRPGERFV